MTDASHVIESFNDLYEVSQRYRKGRWIFRGVSNSQFELIPKIGRQGMQIQHEERIFETFIRDAVALADTLPSSEWELLAIAQHHGLPTRLLDWTENPLVAAFFACWELDEHDGAIYMLQTNDKVKGDDYRQSPFRFNRFARFRPNHITRRIHAQRGVFTIHPDPQSPILLSEKGPIKVYKAIVNKSFKHKLQWNLSRFNVNLSSLFPDLDGLARQIMWNFTQTDPSDEPEA